MRHDPDLPAAPIADLPNPYCKGPWRGAVIGLGLGATVVFAISVGAFYRSGSGLHWMTEAAAAPARTRPVQSPGRAPVEPVPAAESNLRLVSTTQRTAFNLAATSIRPSVVGIRANLAPAAGQPSSERLGSGLVVDPAGYAVTCRHVVAGAESVVASRFREPQRWLPAQLVAVEGDMALLKIMDRAPFAPATLGDSERVQVGDWVLAAGHPFGLGLTVTAGIVGQRHATLAAPGGGQYVDLLQTDAPINEGSSGGPLINAAGQVVGLNTAIYSPNGAFSGAGFAIPSNRVRQFIAGVLDHGARPNSRATWGFGVVDLTPSLAAELGYPGPGGAVVRSVEARSAAELAGLLPGDVILAVAAERVTDVATLDRLRDGLSSQSTLVLQLWRQGRAATAVLRPGTVSAG